MAQQRTSGLRRNKPNARGVQFASYDWLIAATTSTVVRLNIATVESGALNPLQGVTLQGVPGFRIDSPANPAISAAINSPFLDIEFASVPIVDFVMEILPNDPAFRGNFGQYLVSKELVHPGPPPAPTDAQVVAVVTGGAQISVDTDGGGGQLYLANDPVFHNNTQIVMSLSARVVGTQIFAEFAAPVIAGDEINYSTDTSKFLNVDGGTMLGFTVNCI